MPTASDPTTASTSSGSTTGTSGDGSTSGTTAVDPTTGDPGSSSSSTTVSFVAESDAGNSTKECDQWLQDCPPGQKCMPYSGDGDFAWESLKCVDVKENPGTVGDPCTVEGNGVTGVDNCDKGLMCWDVDPETNEGFCVAMCVGTPDSPSCNVPNATCLVSNDGVLTLCLTQCDPLIQDCPGTSLCVPNPQNFVEFICFLDASGEEGQAFDACEYYNSCDKGFLCGNPGLGMECDPMALGCCLPYCDLSQPNECPGASQECLPWYEMGMEPPGYENVGICGIPQ
jgi:hypothetical protein